MEALQVYKSFNSNKSIEELQYNVSKEISKLENLNLELEFYLLLIKKPIFKNYVMNLFETLNKLKSEIKMIDTHRINLLNDLLTHSNQIINKIECDDIACDNYFIKEHDDIELKVFNFNNNLLDFKFKLLQYLQNVIID